MLITREREKLINAIIFFVTKTRYCGATKLFKLLNFLDFIHFRETGRSVTGLKYYAWPRGPVPRDLFFEIRRSPGDDLEKALSVVDTIDEDSGRAPTKIRARTKFDSSVFTRRELRILDNLAFIFAEVAAEEISEISHLKGSPWQRTKDERGEGEYIDYYLSVDNADEKQLDIDMLREKVQELNETRRMLN